MSKSKYSLEKSRFMLLIRVEINENINAILVGLNDM